MTTLLYYEFPDEALRRRLRSGVSNVVTISHKYMSKASGLQGPVSLNYVANRVWAEYDDGLVALIKDRYDTPVDMKEFFWIKLQAVSL